MRGLWGALALILLLVAAPHVAETQSTKIPRIGLLGVGSAESSPLFDVLRKSLRELGWVDGQNVAFEDRTSVAHYDLLADAAAELVRLKVDVLVVWGSTPTMAAKQATATIPIVVVTGSDPTETGLVTSLGRPGGNVTGMTTGGSELVGKRLALLKEAVPRLSRVAVLWNSESRTSPRSLKAAEDAAASLGIRVQSAEVRKAEDLDKVFAHMAKEHQEGFIPLPSNLLKVHRARVADLALRNRLPAIYQERSFVDAGGLMSYGPDEKAVFRRLASYVNRILRGAKPGDLPIEQPTKFELVINKKAVKALGLTIPPSLLLRADELIE